MVLSVLGYVLRSYEGYGYVYGSHVNSQQPTHLHRVGSSSYAHAMPRIKGRPRRGTCWYAAESRRKRHKNFTQAIRAVQRKRRAIFTTVLSPPRTFGEEDPPFMHSQTALSSGDPPQPSIAPSETYAACIVEEEILGCAEEEETPACVIGEQDHPPNDTTMGDPP